jgi:hypothetical protein
VVNKMPRSGGRLDLDALSRAVRDARGLITLRTRPATAAQLTGGDFSWDRAPADWDIALAELCAVIASDWRDLELSS